ncbi:MAG: hypothetical protein CR982_09410 [Candidatus Cloacimonadota bacterium]|nr:MAG: hypothetical protein CR982_09410 [Candidatus Cloacimonadota bacterium]PIE77526.1 MAG: hypothetical protein CSA15_12700 [Candidatus Delongbacteria bacterium]
MKLFILFAIIISLYSCSDDKYVAKSKISNLTRQQFWYNFITYRHLEGVREAFNSSMENRERYANLLGLRSIKAALTENDSSILNSEEFIESCKKLKRDIKKKIAQERFILSEFISESEIEESYKNYSKAIFGTHIFLPKSLSDSSKIRALRSINIDKILDKDFMKANNFQIKTGWHYLFQSPYLFEKEVWNLNVGDSRFVNSESGYHYFILDSVKKILLTSFFVERENILYGLRSQFGTLPQKQTQLKNLYKSLRERANIEVDYELLDRFYNLFNNKKLGNRDPVDNIPDSMLRKYLIKDFGFKVSDLLTIIRRMSFKYRREVLLDKEDFIFISSSFYMDKFYKILSEKLLDDNDDEVLFRFNLRKQFILEKLYNQKYIVNSISIDTLSVKKDYNKFIGSIESYTIPKDSVMEIYIPFNSDNRENKIDLASNILKKIRGGEPFEKFLSNEYSRFRNKKGKLYWISSKMYGNIGKEAIKLENGQISDLIINNNSVSIIKVYEKKRSRVKTFLESYEYLEEKLLKEKIKIRTKEINDSLIGWYQLDVDTNQLYNWRGINFKGEKE